MNLEKGRPPLAENQKQLEPTSTAQEYERLKNEVKTLRIEKKEVLRARQAKKEVAAQHALAMREDWEAKLAMQEATINKLKAHLNDTNQRSSKMRMHYERREKAASIKCEKSCRAIEEERSKHKNEIQELKRGFETTLTFEKKIWGEQLEERDKAMDLLRERLELEKEAAIQEIVKGSGEQVSSMQDRCLEATSRLNEVDNNWRAVCDALKLKRDAALETIHERDSNIKLLEATIEQLRKEIDFLGDRHEQDKDEIKSTRKDLQKQEENRRAELHLLREEHAKEMEVAKERRSEELQTIQHQIESVLASKDEAILHLNRKLKESNSIAKALEAKMEEWKTHLKEC